MTIVRFGDSHLRPRSIDRLFNPEFFFDRWTPGNFDLPSINRIETDKDVKVEMSVPGFEKDQIKVSVENDFLIVQGDAEKEEKESKHGYYEFRKQSFERKFRLDDILDTGKIDVALKSGILHITIPKKENMPPKRKEISIG